MAFFQSIQRLFEPEETWPLRDVVQFKRQRQMQALWIGILAFVLPFALYLGNRASDCFRDSVSHSYYLPVWGDVFVAGTCSVGLLLMFYRGQSRWERALALFGGVCAIVVALYPTNGSGCDDAIAVSRVFLLDPADAKMADAYPVNSWVGKVHLGAAIALFVSLAIFNLFVFTATDRTNDYQTRGYNRNKVIRNWIYAVCGVLMVLDLAVLVAGFGFARCDGFDPDAGLFASGQVCEAGRWFASTSWDETNLTFYFEWLGLALFGIAWIVKGRGGGFLLLDETPRQMFSRPWWMGGAG